MNWRLLSREEIAWNRKARQRRKNQHRQRRRREAAITSLADAFLVAAGVALDNRESTELLCSWSLRTPLALARRTQLLTVAANQAAKSCSTAGIVIPRPSRCLHRSRRSTLRSLPVSLADNIGFVGFDAAIAQARRMVRRRRQPITILRYLCRPEVTGLDLEQGVQVAVKHGIVTSPVPPKLLERLKRWASFETRLADAQALFYAMTKTGVVPPVAGEWAYFPVTHLMLALPGIKLPRALRRDEFLVRIFRNKKGRIICLDLHSMRFKGLCRHPLAQPPGR